MTEDTRERIPGLCSRETEGPSTMLFCLEGGDAKRFCHRKKSVGVVVVGDSGLCCCGPAFNGMTSIVPAP